MMRFKGNNIEFATAQLRDLQNRREVVPEYEFENEDGMIDTIDLARQAHHKGYAISFKIEPYGTGRVRGFGRKTWREDGVRVTHWVNGEWAPDTHSAHSRLCEAIDELGVET